jgi:hypothetical protein
LKLFGGEIKKKIPGCNSDKKLIFGKKKVATLASTQPIQLILRISEVLGSSKKNKRSILTSCAVWYPERTKVATGFLFLLALKP